MDIESMRGLHMLLNKALELEAEAIDTGDADAIAEAEARVERALTAYQQELDR